VVWKLLLSMKVSIFVLYCWVSRMTRDVPLSADVMVASFSWSLVFMERKVLYSEWSVGVVCVWCCDFSFVR
jgi:hypothetical protein